MEWKSDNWWMMNLQLWIKIYFNFLASEINKKTFFLNKNRKIKYQWEGDVLARRSWKNIVWYLVIKKKERKEKKRKKK